MNYKPYAKIAYGFLLVIVFITLFAITKTLSHDIKLTIFDVIFLVLIIYGLPISPYILLGLILKKDVMMNSSKILTDYAVILLVSLIGIFVQFLLFEDQEQMGRIRFHVSRIFSISMYCCVAFG